MTIDRIVVDPAIMQGKPVVRGTRVPVEILLRKLAQNLSVEHILADYPQLTEDDIKATIEHAAAVLQHEVVYSPGPEKI